VGNTHEVAQRIDPGARVVYVDNEPVAVAHSELILQHNENAAILRADIRDVPGVLGHQVTRRLIDFDQPVALLMFAVLHFMPDDQHPYRLVAEYRDATVPGSCLALSHVTADGRPEVSDVLAEYSRSASQVTERDLVEVTQLFDGYDVVSPGVVFTRAWRPEIELEYRAASPIYGGVGLRI
jgi:SAM-dependent methyltransferase